MVLRVWEGVCQETREDGQREILPLARGGEAVAIYQQVQLGQDGHAWTLALVAGALAFFAVWGSERLLRRRQP